MIEYLIGAVALGTGIAIAEYFIKERKFNEAYKEFKKAVKENERLFNRIIGEEEIIDKMAKSINLQREISKGKDLLSKLN